MSTLYLSTLLVYYPISEKRGMQVLHFNWIWKKTLNDECVKLLLTNKTQSIYKFGLSVCLFVSNKRQNGWTDRAQNFCGTSWSPREGLWMIKISNICLHQNSIFIELLKIHEFFCENPRIIFVLFYDIHKENMFTINLEDEASFLNFDS